jgi:nucleoside-diphosphate-sugar epimerase
MSRDALSTLAISKHPNLKIISGDVLDLKGVIEAMRGSQVVVHMAGVAGIDTVIKEPAKTMGVNMAGTANMLEAARLLGNCERFIDFSTSEVFGNFTYRARESESTIAGAVGHARWTYAVSKLAAEHLTYAYFSQHKLPTVTVRPFNIYGPGQVGEGAVHTFVTRAIRGQTLEIHGDGTQIRAWTYIDDMIDGIICCLTNPKAVGNTYNIGNPKGAITIYFLAKMIRDFANPGGKVINVPKNYVDVELRIPNIDKAESELDFHPQIELEEGLRRTIDWYRQQIK